jgi:hypothetical protein
MNSKNNVFAVIANTFYAAYTVCMACIADFVLRREHGINTRIALQKEQTLDFFFSGSRTIPIIPYIFSMVIYYFIIFAYHTSSL